MATTPDASSQTAPEPDDRAQAPTVLDKEFPAEWLVTNRIGSFAMGSPDRRPRRKYHGLLIARPPGGTTPWHLAADVDERLRIGDSEYALASYQYDSCVHPDGAERIASFHADPPTWVYRCGDAVVERRVELAKRGNRVEVHYQLLEAKEAVELLLTPLLTGRPVHGLVGESSDRVTVQPGWDDAFEITFRDIPGAVQLRTRPAAGAERVAYWNQRVHYDVEQERGYPHVEDLFAPVQFRHRCEAGESITIEIEYGVPGEVAVPPRPDARDRYAGLPRAAQTYVIERPDGGASIVAGYPWFGEWGRDTFIALPGLTLVSGNFDLAAAILDYYCRHRKNGLIPNIVKPGGDSDDHSVDATLFFVRAVRMTEEAYAAAHGDDRAAAFVERWADDILELLEVLRDGGCPGVRVDDSGLLAADRRPRAMTWMDALVDGVAVTPRAPYAVEIQALFYDAILYALTLAKRRGANASSFVDEWQSRPEQLRTRFLEIFDCGTHLADSFDGSSVDAAVRPNQLFALASSPLAGPSPLVDGELAQASLASVRESLLTPYGLRTLEPGDPRYHGHCVGTQPERDAAYHEGTVWAWLLGPYVDAVAAVDGASAAADEAGRLVAGFRSHIDNGCWGQISEIFDGDAPHTPRGAPAQAWSVSEVLRLADRAETASGLL